MEQKVKQFRPNTYKTLVSVYNRERKTQNQIECECGKMVFQKQMEKHIQTKYHAQLLQRKQLYEEYLVQQKEKELKRIDDLNQLIFKLNQELLTLKAKYNVINEPTL